MITLDVKPYCHGCRDFEPECETLFLNKDPIAQVVRCKFEERCERMNEHIRRLEVQGD